MPVGGAVRVEVEVRARKGRASWVASLHRLDTGECLTGQDRIIAEVGPRREAAEQGLIAYLNGLHPREIEWRYQEARPRLVDLMRDCPSCGALLPKASRACTWCGGAS